MKLLFDHNLSPRLATRLQDLYPASCNLRDLGLADADDRAVWRYGRENGFVIVSKDSDFRQMSFVLGHPPKVIWLRIGNGPTAAAEMLLRERCEIVRRFCEDPDEAFLALG